jgi:hypothetical protein
MQDILATQLTDKQLVDQIEKTFADKNEIIKFPIYLDDEDIKYIVEQNGVDKLVKLCTSPDNSHKIAYISKPDKDIILKAADIAFKLKGSYAPTKTDNTNKNIDLVALFLASQKNQNETDTL